MKLFLSADMEGTCGIAAWPETERATPMDYAALPEADDPRRWPPPAEGAVVRRGGRRSGEGRPRLRPQH